MSMRTAAALLATLLITLLSTLSPAPAVAHATLVSSNPEDGAKLDSEPSTVTLTFNEDVATPAQLHVVAPDGTRITEGAPTIDGRSVEQQVPEAGVSGEYEVAYRVISADGHPVTGELTYTVSAGESGDAAPAEDEEESFIERHRTHLLLGVAGVVVAGVLLAWPWIRRRG